MSFLSAIGSGLGRLFGTMGRGAVSGISKLGSLGSGAIQKLGSFGGGVVKKLGSMFNPGKLVGKVIGNIAMNKVQDIMDAGSGKMDPPQEVPAENQPVFTNDPRNQNNPAIL
jgi:hypothetical protein